jgi:uncharacterized protein (TIGR02996 family)
MPTLLDGLYEQVFARPEDDGPRVVLADHLTELGDPLGEFIAIQLAEPNGPTGLAKGRVKQLKRHYEAWLPPGVQRSTAIFRRGFLHACRWTAPTDPTHRAWKTVEQLTCATVVGLAEFDRSALFAGEPLPRLKELREVDPNSFEALCKGRLKERLGILRTSFLDPDQLAARAREFTALHTLDFEGTELTDKALSLLCGSLAPSARWLHVGDFAGRLSLSAAREAARLQPGLSVTISVDRQRLSWFELSSEGLKLCHRRASTPYMRGHLMERARKEGLTGVVSEVDR